MKQSETSEIAKYIEQVIVTFTNDELQSMLDAIQGEMNYRENMIGCNDD